MRFGGTAYMYTTTRTVAQEHACLRLGGNESAPMDIDDHFDLLVNDPGYSGELPPRETGFVISYAMAPSRP